MLVLSCFVIAMLKDRELSSEARRTLLGSFVHVANLQLAGELTTRAHISESCETHINTIKLALGQLVEFEILDLEKTQSSMGYKTASYSVAQSLLAAARAPA